jgi:alanine-glyoxylate transaminase/serine-glyoxylate transaminase/serine-pyruvate transaminase
MVLEEGLENRFARHRAMHELLKSRLAELGITYASDKDHSLPMLNAVTVPPGADDAATRKRLLEDYGIEIGAGLGVFKGRVWRIGLMGHSASKRNVMLIVSALREILAK